MRQPTTIGQYFKNVWGSMWTALVGMRITGGYFFTKPITFQYPDERMPIPDRFRGIHYLEQEKCIYCFACARACPVDCIEMDAVRHGKELEWVKFTIDYQKCLFCELCVYPCPTDCIHMGTEFALVTEKREELILDLVSYRGMSREARIRMKEAEKKKAAKAAAKKAKAAADAKDGAEAKEGSAGDGAEKKGAEKKAADKPAAEKKGKKKKEEESDD